jgi:hypothetical protein
MAHALKKSLVLSSLAAATFAAALPSAAQAQEVAPAGASAHSQFVGRLGVGYLGRRSMAVGALNNSVDAPVIGVRYWLDDMLGIDVGLGLSSVSQSSEVKAGGMTTKTDGPSGTAIILHGGVPLSLYAAKNYSFQITPELNIGTGSGTQEIMIAMVPEEVKFSGFHFDIGARAGAEIHFGFIGIPELSLQGSVGLNIASDSATTDTPQGAGARSEAKQSQTVIGTTVGNNPWNIFTSNVAALYYF